MQCTAHDIQNTVSTPLSLNLHSIRNYFFLHCKWKMSTEINPNDDANLYRGTDGDCRDDRLHHHHRNRDVLTVRNGIRHVHGVRGVPSLCDSSLRCDFPTLIHSRDVSPFLDEPTKHKNICWGRKSQQKKN